MSKLEKMPKEELVNVLSILLKYDPQLKDYDLEFGPEAVNIKFNGQPCGGLAVRNIYDAYERAGDVLQIADVVKDCILKLKPQPSPAQPFRQMGQQPVMPKKEPVIIEVKASRVLEILEEMNSPKAFTKSNTEPQVSAVHNESECNEHREEKRFSGAVSPAKINQNVNDFLTATAKQQAGSNEFSLDDDDEAEPSAPQTTSMAPADGSEVAPAGCDSTNFTSSKEAKEDVKKSSNPQANMGLKDAISTMLGVPEAGSEEAETAAQDEEDRFDL